MSEVKLLPCPFCGGKSSCCYDTTEQRYKVFCNDCGIAIVPQYPDVTFMPNFNTLKETIRTWNTRKPMEQIAERLEESMDRQWCYYNNAKGTGNIRQMDYSDGCAEGLTTAIEIVKEVGGFCD